MKLTKEHIAVFAVFITVLTSLGALYQFYYVPRLQVYKENIKRRDELKTALARVEKNFDNTDPEVIIKAVKDQIQPLQEEVIRRAGFFNLSDINTIEPIPENKIFRIYYTEQYNKMLNDLRQEAYSKNVYIPEQISFSGAPQPNELAGLTMTVAEVNRGLKRVKFGCSMYKMLFDSKAPYITQVVLWPNRLDASYDKLLWTVTTGCSFWMTYPDLVAFLEKLRLSDRFFAVNAVSLQNRSLRVPNEPYLEVGLLITQATFNPPAPPPPPGQATTATPSLLLGGQSPEQRLLSANITRTGSSRRRDMELTKAQRYWRTFKKYFWPF